MEGQTLAIKKAIRHEVRSQTSRADVCLVSGVWVNTKLAWHKKKALSVGGFSSWKHGPGSFEASLPCEFPKTRSNVDALETIVTFSFLFLIMLFLERGFGVGASPCAYFWCGGTVAPRRPTVHSGKPQSACLGLEGFTWSGFPPRVQGEGGGGQGGDKGVIVEVQMEEMLSPFSFFCQFEWNKGTRQARWNHSWVQPCPSLKETITSMMFLC